MILGLGSYALAWSIGVRGFPPPPFPVGPEEVLALARAGGLRLVQFADNCPLVGLPADRLHPLLREARSAGVALEIGGRGLTAENLKEHLEFAREHAIRLVRMVVDQAGYEPGEEEIIDRLRRSVPWLRAHGVRLALENHDRIPVARWVAMMEAVGAPEVGICLDTVNSLGCGEGWRAVLDALAPYTINLHLKDYRVRRAPHSMGFLVEGTPAGQGHLPIPALLGRMRTLGRCETALLELWPPPEPDPGATAALEQRWVAESLAYLGPLFADYFPERAALDAATPAGPVA